MVSKPKQVIVLRKDLGMRPGKCVAQGSHASLGAAIQGATFGEDGDGYVMTVKVSKETYHWFKSEFTKICCSVNSEQELLDLHAKALEAGLPSVLIKDAGHTVFHGVPTYTAIAVGPASEEDINSVTGHLKLY